MTEYREWVVLIKINDSVSTEAVSNAFFKGIIEDTVMRIRRFVVFAKVEI
ncbi:hypothetical protein [Methanomethylovorans sp.]